MADKPDPKCTIYVSNIAVGVPTEALRQFFSYCGSIKSLRVLGPTFGAESKYCIVEFQEAEHANAGALLTGIPLLNKPIQVSVNAAAIPKALVDAPPSSDNPSSPPAPNSPPSSHNQALTLVPTVPIMAPQPPQPSPTTPPNPSQMPTSANAQKAEEVARTVYVGNLNPKINPDTLVKFFTACGPVSFCRMAGDDSHPARFAFIEFETLTAAQIAMTLNGAMLLDRAIKVNHSKNPIVKPPAKVNDPRKEEDAKRALRRAQEALTRKLTGGLICCSHNPKNMIERSVPHHSNSLSTTAAHTHRLLWVEVEKRGGGGEREEGEKAEVLSQDRDPGHRVVARDHALGHDHQDAIPIVAVERGNARESVRGKSTIDVIEDRPGMIETAEIEEAGVGAEAQAGNDDHQGRDAVTKLPREVMITERWSIGMVDNTIDVISML